jgi:predicted HAD superfamily Cof-like phosphohydrolase
MTAEEMVRRAHARYGALAPELPAGEVPESTRTMRMDFFEEEVREFREAVQSGDVEQIAKEGADVCYVVIGSVVSCGGPFDEVFAEVHRSNMTKEPAGNGKAVKGPGYEPADIHSIFTRRRELAGKEPGL